MSLLFNTADMSEKCAQHVQIGARLDKEFVARVDEIARRQYSTRSGIIRQALDAFFGTTPKPASRQRKSAAPGK
jgi:metal-responsive CopG/Arc/MetJ family transcriptional regulator